MPAAFWKQQCSPSSAGHAELRGASQERRGPCAAFPRKWHLGWGGRCQQGSLSCLAYIPTVLNVELEEIKRLFASYEKSREGLKPGMVGCGGISTGTSWTCYIWFLKPMFLQKDFPQVSWESESADQSSREILHHQNPACIVGVIATGSGRAAPVKIPWPCATYMSSVLVVNLWRSLTFFHRQGNILEKHHRYSTQSGNRVSAQLPYRNLVMRTGSWNWDCRCGTLHRVIELFQRQIL